MPEAEEDTGMYGADMQVKAHQTKEEIKNELGEEVLDKINLPLDNMAMAATANDIKMEQIVAMTFNNITMSSKVDALMAENMHMKAESERMKADIANMKKGIIASTGGIKPDPGKTETELNSNGQACAEKKTFGRFRNYWFFEEKQSLYY